LHMLHGWRARLLIAAALAACGPASAAQTPARALPDWYGVWQVERAPRGNFNFDQSVPFGTRESAPLTPEYDKLYVANLASASAGRPVRGTAGECLPVGMPRIMATPLPREFVVTPKTVYIINEVRSAVRRIFTDGRAHPSDLDPTVLGHSIGHWEAETLVVDTVGVKAGLYDGAGLPHSDALHIVERIRRTDATTLEIQFTFDDPKALTRPWTITRVYKVKPDWTIAEDPCGEGNGGPTGRSANVVGVDGAPSK
jgi:hypothetical protein